MKAGHKGPAILFTILHPAYTRGYEEPLRILLARGHVVHLAFVERAKKPADLKAAELLADEFPGLRFGYLTAPKLRGWYSIAWFARGLQDYARYMHPRYATADALRDRVGDRILARRGRLGPVLGLLIAVLMLALQRLRSARLSDALVGFFRWIDHAVPVDPGVLAEVRSYGVVTALFTPQVTIGKHEPEVLKAARTLGLRTGLCVASWDNLTNKGLIKFEPDRVLVWNEIQRREAATMHRIPADKVVLTGAQRFDGWFSQNPSGPRANFLTGVGLDASRPYILYLCSSPFIAPHEVSFVREFITGLRASKVESLVSAGVLVRPHPQNATIWADDDLGDLENVSVWPPAGQRPDDASSKSVFFDSMFHSAAVFGINTSALIEAGIVDKTVHTVRHPDFALTQGGTLHFHYLLQENGGLLFEAKSMPELFDNLDQALRGTLDKEQTQRFIDSFVRPLGRELAASPAVADAMEAVTTLDAMPALKPSRMQLFVRIALWPVAMLGYRRALRMHSKHLLKRVRGRLPARLRRAAPEPAKDPRPEVADLRVATKRLKSAGKGEGPVIVGPWMGSVSDELMWWIPFLRWATQQRFGLDPERLIVVSRGGCSSWYRGLTDQYVDALDLVDFEIFRRHRDGEGEGAALEHLLVDALRARLGTADVRQLEPKVMRTVLRRYWRESATINFAMQQLDVRRLRPPVDPGLRERLPASYLAMQLTFSAAFPETPRNQVIAKTVLAHVAERFPVVLLGSGIDNEPAAVTGSDVPEDVVLLVEDLDPREALHYQSVAVANARAFVGTHGAMCHLAPRYQVPVTSLVADASKVLAAEIDVAERYARKLETPLTMLDAYAASVVGLYSLTSTPVRRGPAGLGRVERDRLEAGEEDESARQEREQAGPGGDDGRRRNVDRQPHQPPLDELHRVGQRVHLDHPAIPARHQAQRVHDGGEEVDESQAEAQTEAHVTSLESGHGEPQADRQTEACQQRQSGDRHER